MSFIINFFKGILIGAGGILPGISSGVLCVVFGIYENLIDSILYFFKDKKKNFKFLIPILLGGLVGVILVSNVLKIFLHKFPLQTKAVFIGLIIGGIPLIIKQIKKKSNIKMINLIYLLFALLLGIFMVYLDGNMDITVYKDINFVYLFISGLLMSIGVVVPGVSSTVILMLLGVYDIYLMGIANMYLPVLIPIGIGVVVGGGIFIKIIKILFDNFYQQTMFAIIGFTLGSIFVLLPEMKSVFDVALFGVCLIMGYYIINTIGD